MKITDVDAIVLRQPGLDVLQADGSQDALLIRIHTAEGVTGVGEVDSLPWVIKAIVEAPPSHANASGLKHLLIGEDPFDIDRLWEKLYRGSIYYGRRGAAIHAISGIEIALWDLKGKALGQPIHQLLGGPRRSSLRAYASTLMPESPAAAAEVSPAWSSAASRPSSWAGARSAATPTSMSPSWPTRAAPRATASSS